MKIATVSLGCDKNRVDTENMLYLLTEAGHTLTEDPSDADVILVNTCAFIESAKKEAIDTILEMAEYKKQGKKLVVAGCMAERYTDELYGSMEEIDALVGVQSENDIVDIVEKAAKGERICKKEDGYREYHAGRVLTTPPYYAYLRIADGCNNHCTYCAIPMIRGRYHSFPMEKLVAEAKGLVKEGVKEIILVAQDTTYYGTDLYGKPMLVELIKALAELPIWKIRVLYAYPELLSDELIEVIAHNEKVAKYIDIPLQHIDDAVLKRMGRRSSEGEIRSLLAKIKSANESIAVRTTFIVGFNGETETAYEKLKSFAENTTEIDYAGFFGYSPEENTPASRFVEKNLPKRVIKAREKAVTSAFARNLERKQKKYVGQTLDVIYEGIDFKKQCFFGRTEYNAPDVDTKVYFTSDVPMEIGEIYKVTITGSDCDLYGKMA